MIRSNETIESIAYQHSETMLAVLGIDSDRNDESRLQSIFRIVGIEVIIRQNLQQILQTLEMSNPSILVLYSSVVSSIECRELREKGFSGNVLIVLDNEYFSVHEYFDAGADDVTYLGNTDELSLRLLAAKNRIARSRSKCIPKCELQDKSSRLQRIVDNHLDYMTRYLPGGIISFVNDSICRSYGMKREEMLGRNFIDFVSPDYRVELTARVKACFEDKKPFVSRQKHIDASGLLRWSEWFNIPVPNANGIIVECQGIGRDITKAIQFEAQFKTEHDHLRMALKAANTLTWVLTNSNRTIESSENSLEVLGITPSTLNDLLQYVVEDDKELVLQFVERAFQNVGEHVLRLRICRPHSGIVRWFQIRCSPIQNAEGVYDRLCGICFDISDKVTEEQEKEKKLQDLLLKRTLELEILYERLYAKERFGSIGMMAARIVHELNGPIAGVRNAFFLIRDGFDPNHKYFEYIPMIEKELDRLIEMLRQLFILYGPKGREKSDIDIRVLLNDACKMMPVILAREISPICIEAPAEICHVRIAPKPFQQVLYNVLTNALKASPVTETVQVEVVQQLEVLRISIRNRGEHIPEDVQQSLFEPFNRTESPRPGLGLGLYISRCLMAELGGQIELESKSDVGTTVILTLPTASNQASTSDSGFGAGIVRHKLRESCLRELHG